jgi:magnesium-transporting ATPase (P-type)
VVILRNGIEEEV